MDVEVEVAEDEVCVKRQRSVANTSLGAKPKKRAKTQEEAAGGEEESSPGARGLAEEVEEEKREDGRQGEPDKKTPLWRKPKPYKSKEAMCQEDFDKKTTKVHWSKRKNKPGPKKKEEVKEMFPSGKVGCISQIFK